MYGPAANLYIASMTSVSGIGIVTNCLLMSAIRARSSTIAAYSIILLNCAIVDMIGAACSLFSMPRVVCPPGKIIFVYHGPCIMLDDPRPCTISSLIMEQMYAISTFLLTFSFAFRLFVLNNATEPRRSTIWLVAILLWIPSTLSTISFYQAYSFDREVALQTMRDYWPPYEEDLRTKPFHLGDIRSVANIYAAMALSYICTSSPIAFTITFYLRWKTIQGLDQQKGHMSESSRKMHKMFVKALNVQIALTTFLGIGCSTFALNLFRIFEATWEEYTVVGISNILPALAPIINLIYIKPYRLYVTSLFVQQKSLKAQKVHTMTVDSSMASHLPLPSAVSISPTRTAFSCT